jgi:chromosomal replication initiator protein
LSSHLRSVLAEREFNVWFSRTSLAVKDDTATLLVPNYLFLNWIKDRYYSLLKQSLILVSGKPMLLTLAVAGSPAAFTDAPLPLKIEKNRAGSKKEENSSLNTRYLFSNFMVGPSNELAHAACMTVASCPGVQYNPLFIYGGPGFGKTHLLCAIGNAILDNNPSAKVYYSPAENFTNNLLKATRFGEVNYFQEKYRHMDCLLLDDIHFLEGKEKLHKEFFNIFSTLYHSGKQIVVSSEKMPNDIAYLEKKIYSLFERGLLADLQPPGEELKMTILHSKALQKGIDLELNVAKFLASLPDSSISSLEWYLTKLIAVSEIQGVEITIDTASKIIESLSGDNKIKPEDIIHIVARHFSVAAEDIKSGRKHREISYPRQIAMYISRKLTKASFLEIGKAFGNKDHSTVVKGFKKIESSIKNSYEVAEQIRRLEEYIIEEKNIKT